MRMDIEQEETPEVQMGPLIDCVFLLLIFFLVVAVTKKTVKELDIRLPDARSAVESKPKDDDLVIRVTHGGTIYVGSDEMTAQTLRSAIRGASINTPGVKVLVEADIRTPMRTMAPILDELQFSGLTNVSIRASTYAEEGRTP